MNQGWVKPVPRAFTSAIVLEKKHFHNYSSISYDLLMWQGHGVPASALPFTERNLTSTSYYVVLVQLHSPSRTIYYNCCLRPLMQPNHRGGNVEYSDRNTQVADNKTHLVYVSGLLGCHLSGRSVQLGIIVLPPRKTSWNTCQTKLSTEIGIWRRTVYSLLHTWLLSGWRHRKVDVGRRVTSMVTYLCCFCSKVVPQLVSIFLEFFCVVRSL